VIPILNVLSAMTIRSYHAVSPLSMDQFQLPQRLTDGLTLAQCTQPSQRIITDKVRRPGKKYTKETLRLPTMMRPDIVRLMSRIVEVLEENEFLGSQFDDNVDRLQQIVEDNGWKCEEKAMAGESSLIPKHYVVSNRADSVDVYNTMQEMKFRAPSSAAKSC